MKPPRAPHEAMAYFPIAALLLPGMLATHVIFPDLLIKITTTTITKPQNFPNLAYPTSLPPFYLLFMTSQGTAFFINLLALCLSPYIKMKTAGEQGLWTVLSTIANPVLSLMPDSKYSHGTHLLSSWKE